MTRNRKILLGVGAGGVVIVGVLYLRSRKGTPEPVGSYETGLPGEAVPGGGAGGGGAGGAGTVPTAQGSAGETPAAEDTGKAPETLAERIAGILKTKEGFEKEPVPPKRVEDPSKAPGTKPPLPPGKDLPAPTKDEPYTKATPVGGDPTKVPVVVAGKDATPVHLEPSETHAGQRFQVAEHSGGGQAHPRSANRR